jgi:hypothetical protein
LFDVSVPNGTRVFFVAPDPRSVPGVSYSWRDGKIVPAVDEESIRFIDDLVAKVRPAAARAPAGSGSGAVAGPYVAAASPTATPVPAGVSRAGRGDRRTAAVLLALAVVAAGAGLRAVFRKRSQPG